MKSISKRLIIMGMACGLGVGCVRGIQLRPGDPGTVGTGLPGAPTISTIGISSGAGIVTSEHLTVLVQTGAVSYRGSARGQYFEIADPFVESGINEIFNQVNNANR